MAKIIINGRDVLASATNDSIKCMFLELVAKSSIWTPKEKVTEAPIYPNVRRGRKEDKGREIAGVRIDDNTYANAAIKKAISKDVKFEDFEVCHIWPGTTYDERYHTLLQNLVMLPRALAALSDHMEDVISLLKYRAWELYGWHPAGTEIPQKPAFYPSSWGAAVPDFESAPEKKEVVSFEDLIKDLYYDDDKEAIEIDKVKRKVPKWLNSQDQICTTILTQFMQLSENGKKGVSREELKKASENHGVNDFMGNFNQMNNFGEKNHAKVFTEVGHIISLWEPVSEFVKVQFEYSL